VTTAYGMVFAAAFVPYLGTMYAKFAEGGGKTYDNHAPRPQLESLPPKRRRAHWAQMNGFEAFPAFAAAVIIAHLTGVAQPRIDLLATIFVAARLAYTFCYIYDKATLRSLVWGIGLACVMGLFASALMAR
jgi:uncharacterized MAPEG superfamily protein